MHYYIEKYYPICIALILSIAFHITYDCIKNVDSILNDLLSSSLTIFPVLLGFLLTILTIINSIDTRRMRFIKESGSYSLLVIYLRTSLILDIVSITTCFIFPFLQFTEMKILEQQVYTALIFLFSYTWISNIRFSSIFIKLLIDPQ
jgi:hypothetical protein